MTMMFAACSCVSDHTHFPKYLPQKLQNPPKNTRRSTWPARFSCFIFRVFPSPALLTSPGPFVLECWSPARAAKAAKARSPGESPNEVATAKAGDFSAQNLPQNKENTKKIPKNKLKKKRNSGGYTFKSLFQSEEEEEIILLVNSSWDSSRYTLLLASCSWRKTQPLWSWEKPWNHLLLQKSSWVPRAAP